MDPHLLESHASMERQQISWWFGWKFAQAAFDGNKLQTFADTGTQSGPRELWPGWVSKPSWDLIFCAAPQDLKALELQRDSGSRILASNSWWFEAKIPNKKRQVAKCSVLVWFIAYTNRFNWLIPLYCSASSVVSEGTPGGVHFYSVLFFDNSRLFIS